MNTACNGTKRGERRKKIVIAALAFDGMVGCEPLNTILLNLR